MCGHRTLSRLGSVLQQHFNISINSHMDKRQCQLSNSVTMQRIVRSAMWQAMPLQVMHCMSRLLWSPHCSSL